MVTACVGAGYQLEKKTPFGGWEKVSEAPIIGETATVPDLTEGEEYEYRVAAVTDAGVGEYSNATPAVKAERKKRNVQRTCLYLYTSRQIPLRCPASEPARELVCDLLASWTAMEFGLSRAILLASSSLAGLRPARELVAYLLASY